MKVTFYFGPRRVTGIRGSGARGKTIVFGLFKRHARGYTEIVPDCSKATLQGIVLGYQKHFRVGHSHNA